MPGAFEKVDRAIELLKAAGIRTDLQLTISRYNLEDFAALRAYATGKRCGTVNLDCDLFEPAEDTGRSLKTFALTEAEQTAVYLSASQAAGNPLRPSCDDDFAALARENSELRGTVPPGMPCAAGLRAFTVTYFGQMLPCACFPLATADLLQMDFEAAWSRIHAAAAEYTRSEECRSCVYFGKCKFCAARYYLASGGTAGHPGCVPCDKKLRALPRVMDEINQQQTKHKEETLL
jgi:radical SAM protein with 4Fe4S-binding SPASM domain